MVEQILTTSLDTSQAQWTGTH